MEKIGGGDQRYWSAKAATLSREEKILAKKITNILGSSIYLPKYTGSPEIAQKETLVDSLQMLLFSADQVEELLFADEAVLVRIKHGHHVAHLEVLD